MSFESKIAELKITLPSAPKPAAAYVPAVRAGDLLFLNGAGPFKDGKVVFSGKVGKRSHCGARIRSGEAHALRLVAAIHDHSDRF
jgi:enamine deaminase RidA (YjgF/YER057c/UK114 family)